MAEGNPVIHFALFAIAAFFVVWLSAMTLAAISAAFTVSKPLGVMVMLAAGAFWLAVLIFAI